MRCPILGSVFMRFFISDFMIFHSLSLNSHTKEIPCMYVSSFPSLCVYRQHHNHQPYSVLPLNFGIFPSLYIFSISVLLFPFLVLCVHTQTQCILWLCFRLPFFLSRSNKTVIVYAIKLP